MPLEVISAEAAWKSALNNRRAKYPTPRLGGRRLYPVPSPEGNSSFKIQRDARVFTMGSCFAREVDIALMNAGFNVTSRITPLSRAVARDASDQQLFNKYTVQSILNEVRWALDPAHPYPGSSALVQTGDDLWIDFQTGGENVQGPLDDMLRFRASYCDSIRNIATADVVILTLGLVESWFDTQSGIYLNLSPSAQVCEKWPGRFELHIHNYAEILEALENLHALIKQHGKPEVRFLTTVSPVPLRITFRDGDVLLANTYSKSVQRAAVEAFAAKHPDVDYFPSYEFVTLGDPKLTWTREDYRHLAKPVIERIMSKVMSKYVSGEQFDPEAAAKNIHRLSRAMDYPKITDIGMAVDHDMLDAKTLLHLGNAHKHLGQYEQAYNFYLKATEQPPISQGALENAIHMAKMSGMEEEKNDLLFKHGELFPDRTEFRAKYAVRPEKNFQTRCLGKLAAALMLLLSIPLAICGFGTMLTIGIWKAERTRAAARALGYFLNASLFNGMPCESIPSHAWRERHRPWAKSIIAFMDRFQKGYCERANKREQPFVDLAMSKGLHKQTSF